MHSGIQERFGPGWTWCCAAAWQPGRVVEPADMLTLPYDAHL
ncbi:hypothetical protein [Kitasatospora albolonga]